MPAEGSSVHGRHCPSLLLSPVKSLQMTNPQGLGQGFYCIRFQTQLVFIPLVLIQETNFGKPFNNAALLKAKKSLLNII